MANEISGHIKMIGETRSFGSNGFRKRELVITTTEQYPQHILVEFVQDKCDILNSYAEGEEVKVSLNIHGREWTNPQGEVKYFNSLQGWRIEKLSEGQNQSATQNYEEQQKEANKVPDDNEFDGVDTDEESDLPF